MQNTNLFKSNLQILFDTNDFYFIQSNSCGWALEQGTFDDPALNPYVSNGTLKDVISSAIAERDKNESDSPILVYAILTNHRESMPKFAIMKSGEVKILKEGYYLDSVGFAPYEDLILDCFNPENIEESKEHFSFKNYDENKEYDHNFKDVFGVDFGYHIRHAVEHGGYRGLYYVSYEGKDNTSNIVKCPTLKSAVGYVLEDMAMKKNNYPVVIWNSHNKPVYAVIDSKTVKCVEDGYYLESREDFDLETAIECFTIMEISKMIA